MSGIPPSTPSAPYIARLVLALESFTDGDPAVDLLIACGKPAIDPVRAFLLEGTPRTISVPRCRAARVLGGLHAHEALTLYFEEGSLPSDPMVLFAEDAVRSAVARELLRWKSDKTFEILLRASEQRATIGLIEALGEFGRSQAIPLLFRTLDDDLCRNAALAALCATPEESRSYAILSLRTGMGANLIGPAVSRRRRATAELIRSLGISSEEWKDIACLLEDDDPAVVVNIAAVGFAVAPQEEFPRLVATLFRVARRLNWLQEDDVVRLLDDHKPLAQSAAKQIVAELRTQGESVNWLSPMWRILGHLEQIDETKRRV